LVQILSKIWFLKLIQKLINNQLCRYIFVGLMAVFIDGLTYFLFMKYSDLEPVWVKRISFIVGSVWAFLMNKFFTFQSKQKKISEPILFTVVYFLGFLLNSASHDLLYQWGKSSLWAFLVATGLSTVFNFIGQKYIVFKSAQEEVACE
jgi:putative flippase GtrA